MIPRLMGIQLWMPHLASPEPRRCLERSCHSLESPPCAGGCTRYTLSIHAGIDIPPLEERQAPFEGTGSETVRARSVGPIVASKVAEHRTAGIAGEDTV